MASDINQKERIDIYMKAKDQFSLPLYMYMEDKDIDEEIAIVNVRIKHQLELIDELKLIKIFRKANNIQ